MVCQRTCLHACMLARSLVAFPCSPKITLSPMCSVAQHEHRQRWFLYLPDQLYLQSQRKHLCDRATLQSERQGKLAANV